ncbi:Uncharacterised protein [Mycobacteroides abscessus subsp. abscessus]|uniref:hypothetical protein n=1 Tax=Mycobacteroides abscessus TaxID=36809 RepID=UPI00092C3C16|nr:hypothetical protein [Mycobacteroides abscessus]SIL04163.1 Uncharacterised protein [Mycobacteroides abscessus subsp. abscessus]SLE09340.1 Uncharacterised protein [Mycobacteroides abscessus subsp. abscessus]
MTDFSRLSNDWTTWSNWMRMSNVTVSVNTEHEAYFKSDDGTFCLRKDGEWWYIDRINDRRERQNDIGSFSTFELAEKFLIWRWTRTVTNAPELGPELYARGMNPGIAVHPTDSEWRHELDSSVGKARLGEPSATIFSYLMFVPTEQIEQRANQAISRR